MLYWPPLLCKLAVTLTAVSPLRDLPHRVAEADVGAPGERHVAQQQRGQHPSAAHREQTKDAVLSEHLARPPVCCYPPSRPHSPDLPSSRPQKTDCLCVGGTSHGSEAVTLSVPSRGDSLPRAEPPSFGYCRTAGISYHFRFH